MFILISTRKKDWASLELNDDDLRVDEDVNEVIRCCSRKFVLFRRKIADGYRNLTCYKTSDLTVKAYKNGISDFEWMSGTQILLSCMEVFDSTLYLWWIRIINFADHSIYYTAKLTSRVYWKKFSSVEIYEQSPGG